MHLSRQIVTVHRNESEVAAIKCFQKTIKAFALCKMKNEGTLQENRQRDKRKDYRLDYSAHKETKEIQCPFEDVHNV